MEQEIISRISRGSKMDQIYLPKNRPGFHTGQYVIIHALEQGQKEIKPYFYNIKNLESLKIGIIKEIFKIIQKNSKFENIIITGSFLDKGFKFNDIDIIIIGKESRKLEEIIGKNLGIKPHIIFIDNSSLLKGLETDPIYQLMLSKCVSIKRIVYKIKKNINYQLLDLLLLKSKSLIDNFETFDGNEKYYLVRNLVAISLFIRNKEISQEQIDKEIKILFDIDSEKIKRNLLANQFLNKFKQVYDNLFSLIIQNIKRKNE